MGNSSSAKITIDLLVERVKNVGQKLSDRDRKLFNHAKTCIAKETERLDDCMLFMDFQDQDSMFIQTNDNPSNSIYVGYDQHDKPQYVWQKRCLAKKAKHFFVNNFRSLLNAVKTVGSIAGKVLPAITFKKKDFRTSNVPTVIRNSNENMGGGHAPTNERDFKTSGELVDSGTKTGGGGEFHL